MKRRLSAIAAATAASLAVAGVPAANAESAFFIKEVNVGAHEGATGPVRNTLFFVGAYTNSGLSYCVRVFNYAENCGSGKSVTMSFATVKAAGEMLNISNVAGRFSAEERW